jgi:hypothetical protein
MPLSEQEFNAVVEKVIASAPPNLSEAEFDRLVDAQIGTAPFEPTEQGSGGASLAVGAVRAASAAPAKLARFAANHPSATQKVLGAGFTGAAATAGGAVGGVPGAIAGGMIRGVTPSQVDIRRVAGRMAGEAPHVAEDAARGLGIQNYAKEVTGMKVQPTDIIKHPNAANALEHYANSQERGILRLYGPDGQVVSGPEARSRPSMKAGQNRVGKAVSAGGRLLGGLSAATGITDFAQTVEPTRRDIGVMGIGAPQPDPEGAELAALDARNKQAMADRQAQQQAQRDAMLAKLKAMFGM